MTAEQKIQKVRELLVVAEATAELNINSYLYEPYCVIAGKIKDDLKLAEYCGCSEEVSQYLDEYLV